MAHSLKQTTTNSTGSNRPDLSSTDIRDAREDLAA